MGLEFFLVDEVGYLIPVDPGLDAGAFGQDAVLVPFSVLEVLVWFELFLGGHPSAAGFTVDVTGFGSLVSRCLDFDLRAVYPAELIPSFLFLVVQDLGLGADLNTRVKLVVDQFDLELKIEISIELVRAKEGIRAALLGRAKDCSVLDDVSGRAVLLGPALEGFAVKDGNEFLGVVIGVSGHSN